MKVTQEMAERTEHLPNCAGWEDCECFSSLWQHSEIFKMQAEIDNLRSLLMRFNRELRLMALLAADSPQFFSTLDVIEAKQIRDNILSLPNAQAQPRESVG